jgi:uncharacterized protein
VKARGGGSAWHREPMVWLIIMIPLSAVVMGAVMLTLAISTYDGLVSDDYYKQGLQINRSMERDALARSYALGADVLLGAAGEAIEVSLSGNLRFQSPEIVQLQLFHATRPGLDRSVALRRVASGRYVASALRLEPGHWYLQLDADGWRLKTRFAALDGSQRLTLGHIDPAGGS